MGKGIGRYHLDKPKVRRVNNLVIIIKDRETLYVFVKNAKSHIIFHRWWQGKGSYPRWRLFCLSMTRNKSLDAKKCFQTAAKHNIEYQLSTREVVIKGVTYNYDSKEEN